jgi:hypothetical protein
MSAQDVDQIILPILTSIGVNLDGVDSVSNFQSDLVVQSCSVLLRNINAAYKLPRKLPDGKAARFRICTDMANAIKVCNARVCVVCACVYVCTCVRVHVCMCLYVYVSVCVPTHTHTHTRARVDWSS